MDTRLKDIQERQYTLTPPPVVKRSWGETIGLIIILIVASSLVGWVIYVATSDSERPTGSPTATETPINVADIVRMTIKELETPTAGPTATRTSVPDSPTATVNPVTTLPLCDTITPTTEGVLCRPLRYPPPTTATPIPTQTPIGVCDPSDFNTLALHPCILIATPLTNP